MATESKTKTELPEMTPEDILNGMGTIKRMLMVGALFAAVGYLLVGAALFLEFTQFHPLIDSFFVQHTGHSLAGGGADRAGMAALNSDLATIHKFPSLLLWMKLGGVAHILVGIFVALAAIVRTLMMVPARLGYEIDG
jgi:small-conductance mechanosensitive channel